MGCRGMGTEIGAGSLSDERSGFNSIRAPVCVCDRRHKWVGAGSSQYPDRGFRRGSSMAHSLPNQDDSCRQCRLRSPRPKPITQSAIRTAIAASPLRTTPDTAVISLRRYHLQPSWANAEKSVARSIKFTGVSYLRKRGPNERG